MDPYALITCRTQEQKSSVATDAGSTHEWNETFVACCGVGLWLACTMGVGWGLLLGCWVKGAVGVGGGMGFGRGGGGVCSWEVAVGFAGDPGACGADRCKLLVSCVDTFSNSADSFGLGMCGGVGWWVGVGGGGGLLLGGGCGVCCVDTSSKFAGSIGLGPVGWGGVGGWGSGGLGQLGVGRAVLVVFYILGAALMAVLIHPAKLLVEVFFIVVLLALWYS
ncbi:hypothetical protein U1Q18_000179 [Sarracenia purpurea var. burkii]